MITWLTVRCSNRLSYGAIFESALLSIQREAGFVKHYFQKNQNFFSGGKSPRKFKKVFAARQAFATFAVPGSYTHHAGRNPHRPRPAGRRPQAWRQRKNENSRCRPGTNGYICPCGGRPEQNSAHMPRALRRGPVPDEQESAFWFRPGRPGTAQSALTPL